MSANSGIRRLSDNERRILAAIAVYQDIRAETLSKHTGIRSHAVRYALKTFIEEGLVSRSIFIDYQRLGYTIFNMFFSLAASSRKNVVEFLFKNPSIRWLTENGGDYRFELTMVVEQFSELPALIDRIGAKFGATLKGKIWTAEVMLYFYGYKQLIDSSKLPSVQEIGVPGPRVDASEIDLEIISALRSTQFRSETDIARSLSIPASTLTYRIARLRKEGVISTNRYIISLPKLGFLEYQLLIDIDGASQEFREAFLGWSAAHRYVLACIRCFGGWEYKLLISVPSSEHAFEFQDEVSSKFSAISDVILIPRRSWIKGH